MDKYRQILESAPDAVVVTDADGCIVWVNDQTEKVFGHARGELLGRAVETLLPDRFADRHAAHRARYVAAPYRRPMGGGLSIVGRRKDGAEFPADVMLSTFESEEGRFAIATVRDVTEQRAAAERIRELQTRLRMAVEGAGLGSWSYDVEHDRLAMDPPCAALFGGQPGDFTNRDEFLAAIHPEDRALVERTIDGAIAVGTPYRGEFRVLDARGAVRWLSASGQLVAGAVERTSLFAGVTFDVTERKRAAELVRESEERLREFVENASDGIFLADGEGRLLEANRAGCRIFGHSADELIGKSFGDFMAPEDVERLWAARGEIGAGATHIGEWRVRHADGSYFFIETSAKILRDGRWQAIVRDVTERREAARAQQELVDGLQKALQEIKVLSGLLPICMHCKQIRDDHGEWHRLEAYIRTRTDAQFSHGICPDCYERRYRDAE